jgi:uncharacterized protein YukE
VSTPTQEDPPEPGEPPGGEPPPEPDPTPEQKGQRTVTLLTRAAIVVGAIVVVVMVLKLYPNELPVKANPGFIDNVFASRVVVAATRAVIVFAAIYVVLSMAILGWRGHWITTFVGVQTGKIEQSVSELDAEVERLSDALKDAKDTMRTLENDLGDTTEELERVARERDELRAALGEGDNDVVNG